MFELALYGICIVFGLIAWGMVTAFYIWPDLRRRSLPEALGQSSSCTASVSWVSHS
jgi:hypothetical protein